MNRQNATKRTIISFSIALLTAITAFTIQKGEKKSSEELSKQLEASALPNKNFYQEK